MATETMRPDGTMGGGGGASSVSVSDGDRLPWLEAVEDQDERQGPSAAKLIGALLVGLAAIAVVIFALFQLGNRDGGTNREPELVAADGPYKQRPAEAGGMKVEGEGDSAFAASEGADPNARINLDAIPEAPVAGARGVAPAEQMKVRAEAREAQTVAEPAPAPKIIPAPAAPSVTPAPAEPTPAPSVGGSAVQLGAFSSNAAAQGAWKSMSGRFASLKPLTNSVVSATVNGKTVYRLRANVGSKADANTLCGKLKVAGETCIVI